MKKIITLLLFIFITFNISFLCADDYGYNSTWNTDPAKIQLEKEGVDDQIGLGRIFVPAISEKEQEPSYYIYQDGQIVKSECLIGKSVFVEPGEYTVVLGSADTKKNLIHKKITVTNEGTTIVPVTWSGLIVRIIDESRSYLREPYEIYQLREYSESIGMKYSADEDEQGEKQDTWLLKPGIYKIIKYKETPKTYINFTTVRVLESELTEITIVMNSNDNFIGAGILPEMVDMFKKREWQRYTSLSGSFMLTSDNTASKDGNNTNITLSTNLENEIKLDKFPYYFDSGQNLSLGFSKEQNQDFRVYSNRIQIPTQFIYYLIESFGIYSRFRLETNIFPNTSYFSSEMATVYKCNVKGDTIDILTNINDIQTAPSFMPVNLEEGFGLNVRLIRSSSRSDLTIKAGLGLSQTFNNDVYEEITTSSDSTRKFQELESINLSGIEATVNGDFKLSNNITYNIELYTLYPFDENRSQRYRAENTIDFRFSNFLSLNYTLTLSKGDKDWTVQNHNLSLDLTFISF
ncbi:MAG: hypothetical protein U9P79_02085 [Candidatus Cloacimonadota bacterium]|nr:hypothetical protein [Candidatus Cloacimonadota bacterium]